MQEAESEGLGAVKIDGGMVDIANQKYAQELLERAEKMDLVE
jgi:citrate lyase beta subunit